MGGGGHEAATAAHRPPDAFSGAVGRATRERERQRVHTFAVSHFVGWASGGDSRTQPTCKSNDPALKGVTTRSQLGVGWARERSAATEAIGAIHGRRPRCSSSSPSPLLERERHSICI